MCPIGYKLTIKNMSRSKRLPIIKDRPRNQKKSTLYWRHIRSTTNQVVRGIQEEFKGIDGIGYIENTDHEEIPSPKSIVNDYDYCDYIFDYRNWKLEDDELKKQTRK
jgi:hypothetical protein